MALGLRKRHSGSWCECLRLEERGDRMHVALEDRLFIARDPQEHFHGPRGVRVEAHDLAEAGAILEMHPSASLKSSDGPPCEGADKNSFVTVTGVHLVDGTEFRPRGSATLRSALSGLFGAREGLKVLTSFSPKRGPADDSLRDL